MSDAPEGQSTVHVTLSAACDPSEALAAVARSIEDDGSDSGRVDVAGGEASWLISREGDALPIDMRQRDAAALLLLACDPPLELGRYARSLHEAARVRPGLTIGALPPRVPALREARRIIDEMIAETEGGDRP